MLRPSIVPQCPTSVEEQIEVLRRLPRGWLDGSGIPFDPRALDWLAGLLRRVVDDYEIPPPYVYPTPEGMARAEWTGAGWDVVANIDLKLKVAGTVAMGISPEPVDSETFSLADPEGERRFGQFVMEHCGRRRG